MTRFSFVACTRTTYKVVCRNMVQIIHRYRVKFGMRDVRMCSLVSEEQSCLGSMICIYSGLDINEVRDERCAYVVLVSEEQLCLG